MFNRSRRITAEGDPFAIPVAQVYDRLPSHLRRSCPDLQRQLNVDSGRRWATVDCRIFTASPLAPYAAKTKTASECGEVPTRGSTHPSYLFVIIDLNDST